MELRDFFTHAATPSLVAAVHTAIAHAEAAGTPTHVAHVAEALLMEPTVSVLIPKEIATRTRAALADQVTLLAHRNGHVHPGTFAFSLTQLTGPAMRLAEEWHCKQVSPVTFLAALLSVEGLSAQEPTRTQETLRAAGLTVTMLLPARYVPQMVQTNFTNQSLGFGTDLTAKARAGVWPACPLVGMERELRRLVVLMSAGMDSIVLVGEPGVGKTAIVEGLAWHLAHGTQPLIPPTMDQCSLLSITPIELFAGTPGRGDLEERLDHMLAFFHKHPTVIPFFDEMHRLLDTDDPMARTVATALKPPMVNGQFRCIGATTDKEYARFMANDEAMTSRFTRLLLQEPDEEATVTILQHSFNNVLSDQARAQHIRVEADTLRATVRLTNQFQRNDRQPRKAIRLLRSALVEKTYALLTSNVEVAPLLTSKDIACTFSDISGIPVDNLDADRDGFYVGLQKRLAQRIKGQPEAIRTVTKHLALQSNGWQNPQRPRGCFLFLGPPGVGKTELALALAEEVIRDRGSLITLNMGEFQGEGARTRFMGADPGFVGFGQVSTVYSKVMMRPYSVVVLDEVEKAHSSLGDPLKSLFEGRGADAEGRHVDFAQCIFVLTSNALHQAFTDQPSKEQMGQYLGCLGGIWSRGLFDYIDQVVLFRPLSNEVLLQILDRMIETRRTTATRPFPAALDEPAVRVQILAWATQGEEGASARRLERALLQWLTTAQ